MVSVGRAQQASYREQVTLDSDQTVGEPLGGARTPARELASMPEDRAAAGSMMSSTFSRITRSAAAAIAGVLMTVSALMPNSARADYVRVQNGAAQLVTAAEKPSAILSRTLSEPEFERSKLETYEMFKMFWASDLPGTSQHGVWALDARGVAHLLEYAMTHTLDGRPIPGPSSTDGPIAFTEGHQQLILHLLEDTYYRAFITQEAVPLLRAAFNLPQAEVQVQPGSAPVDAGEARVCPQSEWWGTDFSRSAIRDLPRSLRVEYDLGLAAGRYSAPGQTLEQKQYELTCLLHQMGSSLNQYDDLALPQKDRIKYQVQNQILDAFFALPVLDPARNGEEARQLRAFFARDYNGSGMGLAQALSKGFDPNDFPTDFPQANGRSAPTTLSMDTSNLRSAMTILDQIRAANGLSPTAISTKDLPSLNYMVGQPSGHYKIGFDESSPPIDKLNYGRLLQVGSRETGFANDPRTETLPPTSGFTFPIDAVTVTGAAVIARYGTTLEIYRASDINERLDVEVVIKNGPDDQPQSWSLKFTDRNGQEVAPKDVVGLLKQGGRILGDGKANASLNTGYWGRCDDNTGLGIAFARYKDLPNELVSPVAGDGRIFIRAGTTLVPVDRMQARDLVYMDLPGIAGTAYPSNVGYRFGESASMLRWHRGGILYTNYGMIDGFDPSPYTQSNHEWVRGDVIRITNSAAKPVLGTIRIGNGSRTMYIPAGDVRSIAQLPDGRVRVEYRYNGGYSYNSSDRTSTTTGKLLTDVDLSGAKLGSDPAMWRESFTIGATDTTTLRRWYEKNVAPTGVTYELFRELNASIVDRLVKGEAIVIPELVIPADSGGGSRRTVQTIATQLGLNGGLLDALTTISEPKLAVGRTVRVPTPTGTITRKIREGDSISSLIKRAFARHERLTKERLFELRAQFRALNPGLYKRIDQLKLPAGPIVLPSHRYGVQGGTLSAMHRNDGFSALGLSLEQLRALNPREDAPLVAYDSVSVPLKGVLFDPSHPVRGDFFMRRTDGVEIVVRADEVDFIEGETPNDVRFTAALNFIQRSKGVFGIEADLSRGISNHRSWVGKMVLFETRGGDRPEWAGQAPLRGIQGPLVRTPGDKIVFAAALADKSTVLSGWYQVDEGTGRILNEGFIYGEPDFYWGIIDKPLNWLAPSTYIGSPMVPEYRVALFVNGVPDLRNQTPEGERIARELNLPPNWRSYIVSDEELEAFLEPEPPPASESSSTNAAAAQ
jgi:hypothetical protein